MAELLLGNIGLKAASQATSETKRDNREPFIMFGYDRQINFMSMLIPSTVLVFTVTMSQENDFSIIETSRFEKGFQFDVDKMALSIKNIHCLISNQRAPFKNKFEIPYRLLLNHPESMFINLTA